MLSVETHSNTISVSAQQFLVPSMVHSLRPHLCQGACLSMTVRRILSSTLVQSWGFTLPNPFIGIWNAASALLESNSSSLCLFFSQRRNFLSSTLLGGTATAILGNTLSPPFDGTRLHWKHHECSLGKHLESVCSYPTGENPYFIGSARGSLLHRALTL